MSSDRYIFPGPDAEVAEHTDEPLYPIQLYIYNEDGRYSSPLVINSEEELFSGTTKVLLHNALDRKVKVVMTDPLDNTIFLSEEGKILFPFPAKPEVRG